MDKDSLHNSVIGVINGETNDIIIDKSDIQSDKDDLFLSMARRLCFIWKKYCADGCYKKDFECTLRNYLLFFKSDIVINNYEPSDEFASLGLNYDKATNKIWVKNIIPSQFNTALVNRVYNVEEISDYTIPHNLTINPIITRMTGGKFLEYKSNEQKLAVSGALRTPEGYSCLVSMSTGGGKSLITQSIAYQKQGLTVVVVPTISLMQDQAQNAKQIINSDVDNEVFYYHTDCDMGPFLKSLKDKKAKLFFVSPESLIKNKLLWSSLEEANKDGYLKNLVIDEAHIIIEWGASFRIDFQCLDVLRNKLLNQNPALRTFLLSATYSDETIRQLKLFYGKEDRWIEIRCDKLRHEINYDVVKTNSYGEKNNIILRAVKLLPRPMILYVKSPDDADAIVHKLTESGYNNVRSFTGKTSNNQREQIIRSWKNNEFDLMVATCAFGVGVDKKDVRTVLHTYVPENPNKYYQEAGRGGRDGLPCLSTLIYCDQDVDSAFAFVSKVITTEKLKGRWFSMFKSKKTISLHDGKYMIDTYVKPFYNEDEVFIDSISNQDVSWNVYVILFLRRHGLLDIYDVQYENNKYVFYIKLNGLQLMVDDKSTEELLDRERESEWHTSEAEFKLIRNGLYKAGQRCWASMFTKTYRLTDDYCAGCNSHIEKIDFESTKTLRSAVKFPSIKAKGSAEQYMVGSRWMTVINAGSMQDTLLSLVDKGIDVLVAPDTILALIRGNSCDNDRLIYCNYQDFYELMNLGAYYASGTMAIVFPNEISEQQIVFNTMESAMRGEDIMFIVCSDQDYYLPFRGKTLTAAVSGPSREI